MSLKSLRAEAKKLGVLIEAQRDDFGWAYWLLNPETREGAFGGDSFCTDHSEIEYKLERIKEQQSAAK